MLRVRPYFTLALVPVIFCHPSALTPSANISIHMITIQHHVRMVCLVRTVDCGPNYIMVGEASDAMSKGLSSLLLTLDIGNYKYLMRELPSSSPAQTHPLLTSPAQPFWLTTESLMEAASGVAATASVSCQTESERESFTVLEFFCCRKSAKK